MSRVWIKDANANPKEGWRYPSLEGSRETDLKSGAYTLLYNEVAKHYSGNAAPVPSREDVDLWVCRNLSIECFSDDPNFEGFTVTGLPMDWRPVPRDEWPVWAKGLALLRSTEDKGVGSTIERLIGPSNSSAFKAWYQQLFGKSCGCKERKEQWDSCYAYD